MRRGTSFMPEGNCGGPALYMGIDGGGSRCRTRLRDERGALLASTQSGGANVYLDFDVALETIRTCVDETLKRAGLTVEARTRLFLGLGLAGVSSAAIARQVETALDGFAEIRVANDAVTACLGAHAGQDGGLIIAGTGSAGLALIDGREIFVGGRGFVLGDDGSGARIGLESWRRGAAGPRRSRRGHPLHPQADGAVRGRSRGRDPLGIEGPV